MRCPPTGLCLHVRYVRCRDGDTIEVSTRHSERIWAIRLIDCWCPELREEGGPEARGYAEEVLEAADEVYCFIPEPGNAVSLLKNLTFDRIPGYLFIGTGRSLNEMLVDANHATTNKRLVR